MMMMVKKPQVFHSECTSVVVMCCTQQHQLFSSFHSYGIMNGVAANINRMEMSSEMCAELLNVQIIKRFFLSLFMQQKWWQHIEANYYEIWLFGRITIEYFHTPVWRWWFKLTFYSWHFYGFTSYMYVSCISHSNALSGF
jgi:hypothetical protein